MTWTRRKLLGGALGVSIGGLVATCQEPGRTPTAGAHLPPPVACANPPAVGVPLVDASKVALQPPVIAAPPTPAEAPTIAPVAVQPVPPKLDAPKLDVPPPPAVPMIELPSPSKDPVAPPPVAKLDLTPVAIDPPKPAPPAIDFPKPAGPDLPPVGIGPTPSDPRISAPGVPVSRPKAEPVPAEPPAKADPSVKVVVRLGDKSPQFEVLSAGDVVLKVTCDAVDVRSHGSENAGTTPLVASGKVRFTAPWCEGTCDSLTVQPDNKSVVLTGVRARSKPGKVETEIVAQTMRFRLGVEPDFSVSGTGALPDRVR